MALKYINQIKISHRVVRKIILTEDLIHKLYQQLRTALNTTLDLKIKDRLIDLGIYVRYLELYKIWKSTQTTESFDQLASHLWRSRETDLLSTRVTYYDGLWIGQKLYLLINYTLERFIPRYHHRIG